MPRSNKPNKSKDIGQFLNTHRKKLAIIAGALAVVVIGLLFVTLFSNSSGQVASSLTSSTAAASSVAGAGSDNALTFKPEAFIGTVLPKGEHAGKEYARETVFFGDSNTERMLYYSDVTGVTLENGFGVASMGIATFTTQTCARFEGMNKALTMPEVAELLQPRRIVITFGTNNVGMQLDKFIAYYKEALDALKKAAPHTDIIIGAIFPVDQYRQNTSISMALIDKMNAALAELAKAEDVKFLNWHEAMLDESIGYSQFESTIQDGVHLSRVGMQAVFDYLCIHPYITEDARPESARSTTAPKRIGTMPGITQDGRKVAGPIDWSGIASRSAAAAKAAAENAQTSSLAENSSVSVVVVPGSSSSIPVQPEVPPSSSSQTPVPSTPPETPASTVPAAPSVPAETPETPPAPTEEPPAAAPQAPAE